MKDEWSIKAPKQAGWYTVQAHGKAYWNGKKWLTKNKGKEIRKGMVTAWKPLVKLTPWFSSDVKPVRIGMYQTDFKPYDKEPGYSYWNGNNWLPQFYTEYMCNQHLHVGESHRQDKKWRGILK